MATPALHTCADNYSGTPMKDFSGTTAVVTGGGSGMGRELVRQLVAEGCAVAMCDVSARGMAETQRLCEAAGLPQGLRITAHVSDVSNEPDVQRFRDEMAAQHATDRINMLFNNAGISGGGSVIVNERAECDASGTGHTPIKAQAITRGKGYYRVLIADQSNLRGTTTTPERSSIWSRVAVQFGRRPNDTGEWYGYSCRQPQRGSRIKNHPFC
jgi:short chain dehydrogenase